MVVLVQVLALALLAALGLTTAHTADPGAAASPPSVDDVFLPSGG